MPKTMTLVLTGLGGDPDLAHAHQVLVDGIRTASKIPKDVAINVPPPLAGHVAVLTDPKDDAVRFQLDLRTWPEVQEWGKAKTFTVVITPNP